jgi:hypothetical protein
LLQRGIKLAGRLLGATRLLDLHLGAHALGGCSQVTQIVVPQVATGDVEGGQVLLRVVKGKHTGADAAGDAKDHRFAIGLAIMVRPQAGIGQQAAQGRCPRHTARHMHKRLRVIVGWGRLLQGHASCAGIGFAGLFHPLANPVFEVLLLRHRLDSHARPTRRTCAPPRLAAGGR